MGQAKIRGSREERKRQAIDGGRVKVKTSSSRQTERGLMQDFFGGGVDPLLMLGLMATSGYGGRKRRF